MILLQKKRTFYGLNRFTLRNIFIISIWTWRLRYQTKDTLISIERILKIEQVSDNGTPKQSSQWPVAINIVDKNDNPSTSRTAQLIVNMFTGSEASGSIRLADVRPNDVDSSGQYQCRIVSGASGVFTIPSGCHLHSTPLKKAAAYSLKITGNDGSHPDVTSSISVKLMPFDNATLHNSVTMRMLNVSGERFLTDYWKPLNDHLRAAVTSTHEARIFSLRSAENAHIDITLSVRHKSSVNDFWSRKQVIKMLATVRERMRGILNVSNINVDYTPCQSTPCQNGGICTSALYLADELEALDSPSLIITSPQLRHQLTCSCQRGFSGPSCELRQDPCTPTPCRNGGSCSRQGSDFRCSCPSAFQGKRCELERNRACDPLPCRNGGSCQETPEGTPIYLHLFANFKLTKFRKYNLKQQFNSQIITTNMFVIYISTI